MSPKSTSAMSPSEKTAEKPIPCILAQSTIDVASAPDCATKARRPGVAPSGAKVAFSAACGQEAIEDESASGGIDAARHAQGGGDAADPGDRNHAESCRSHGRHDHASRVTDGGGAGIADHGDPVAGQQASHHRLRAFVLVVLVHGNQARPGPVDAVAAQQGLGLARVLAGHRFDQRQYMKGAQADIRQIADGRCHHIQAALRIILRAGRLMRGRQSL